jgi:hypothetical protein
MSLYLCTLTFEKKGGSYKHFSFALCGCGGCGGCGDILREFIFDSILFNISMMLSCLKLEVSPSISIALYNSLMEHDKF